MYYIDAHTHLLDLSIASLKEMSLHNIRGVISPVHLGAFKPVSKDTIIDVSKNTYSGKTDYELECDSDSAHKSQDTLRTLCEEVGVPFVLNNLSKETRAINAATGSK